MVSVRPEVLSSFRIAFPEQPAGNQRYRRLEPLPLNLAERPEGLILDHDKSNENDPDAEDEIKAERNPKRLPRKRHVPVPVGQPGE